MRRVALIVSIIAFALVSWASAMPAHADLSGHRWGRFDQAICVKFAGENSKPLYLLDNVVKQWNALPDLKVTRKANCSGYAQKVIIRDVKAGKDRSAAWTSFTGTSCPTGPCPETHNLLGMYWGQDSEGYWGWLRKSPIKVFMNTSYRWTYASYKGALAHETGHAVAALTHTDRCDSVMSEVCYGRWIVTEFDAYEVERQYPW